MARKGDIEMDVGDVRTPFAAQGAPSYGAMTPKRPLKPKQAEQRYPTPWSGLTHSRSFVWSTMRDHSHYWYSQCYQITKRTIIYVTIINYVLETEIWFQQHCSEYFFLFEAFASAFCFLQYFLKIGTAGERKRFRYVDPVWAGATWMVTFEGIVDLLSWLPTFVEAILHADPSTCQALLLLRLIRMFQSFPLLASFRLVQRVLYFNARILFHSFLICALMLLVSAIALFYTRPEHDTEDNFASILACMYLAILMLTGQGIPNGTMPWYTRIVVAVTALFAIAQFAIPASMLTWGFENEAEIAIGKSHEKKKKKAIAIEQKGFVFEEAYNHLSSSSSGESEREEEWNEYLEQILGDDAKTENAEDAAPKDTVKGPTHVDTSHLVRMADTAAVNLSEVDMKRARAIFVQLDEDGVGFLAWDKFRAITGSDAQARELLERVAAFQEVTGQENATLKEFLIWLGHVKANYPRHGDKVLLQLLKGMEEKLAKHRSSAKSRWKRAHHAVTLANRLKKVPALKTGGEAAESDAVPAPDEGALTGKMLGGWPTLRTLTGGWEVAGPAAGPTASSPQQLLDIAKELGDLEGMNAGLREKCKLLEKELRRLKTAT